MCLEKKKNHVSSAAFKDIKTNLWCRAARDKKKNSFPVCLRVVLTV